MADWAFPECIRSMPRFEGPFDAFRLEAHGCQVLFASYLAGTKIEPHAHPTENAGVVLRGQLILETERGEHRFGPGDWYHLAASERHWARFEVDTAEIEFWFEVAT